MNTWCAYIYIYIYIYSFIYNDKIKMNFLDTINLFQTYTNSYKFKL